MMPRARGPSQAGTARTTRMTLPVTTGNLVRDLVDRVFGGSAAQLVLRALSERKASAREIAEIRDILDTFEKGKRK